MQTIQDMIKSFKKVKYLISKATIGIKVYDHEQLFQI
jgi:hypothetical protein